MKDYSKQKEKLHQLVDDYYQTNDQEILGEIIQICGPIIQSVYQKNRNLGSHITYEDLISLTFLRLKEALDRRAFDREILPLNQFIFMLAYRSIVSEYNNRKNSKNKILTSASPMEIRDGEINTIDSFAVKIHDDKTVENMIEIEKYKELILEIEPECSTFELLCLFYYLQDFNYTEIAHKIATIKKKDSTFRLALRDINVGFKSVDNALARIKKKFN